MDWLRTLIRKWKYKRMLNRNKLWGWVGNHEQRLNRLEERIRELESNNKSLLNG